MVDNNQIDRWLMADTAYDCPCPPSALPSGINRNTIAEHGQVKCQSRTKPNRKEKQYNFLKKTKIFLLYAKAYNFVAVNLAFAL